MSNWYCIKDLIPVGVERTSFSKEHPVFSNYTILFSRIDFSLFETLCPVGSTVKFMRRLLLCMLYR